MRVAFYTIALLLITMSRALGQADITLNSANTTGNYTATHRIALSPGFSANGSVGAFGAKIVAPALFSCGNPGTPSSDMNYVATYTPRIPLTDATTVASHTSCEVNQTIQYVDGLGRQIQTVQVNGNPDGTKDVIQPFAYDQFGRQVTRYLPYTTNSGTSGYYRPDALAGSSGYSNSAQFQFYQQTGQNYNTITTPSASTGFEPSPVNRVTEQGAPGDAWQLTGTVNASGVAAGHTTKIIYAGNDGITYWAKQFGVGAADPETGMRTLIDEGSYGANILNVTISQDRNWTSGQSDARLNTTEEYKDKEGHVVLKRIYNNNNGVFETLSTYYVYDDLGNLSYVLPPKAEADGGLSSANNSATITNLCYQYNYDERNRLTQKRIPGKDWEYMVYNNADQVVATQDGNQRANNQWLITKYDTFGRVIITGIWNSAMSPAGLKTNVYAQSTNWETRDNTQTYGYTLTNTYPNILDNVLTVNYYDDYNFPAAFNPKPYVANPQITQPQAMPSNQSTMTHGLLTGSLTAILNGTNNHTDMGNMLWTVDYYDDQGRVIQTNAQHYLGGAINNANYDQISNGYDFTNAITQTIRVHYTTGGSTPAVIIANSYVYDHMGRKRQTLEKINNAANNTLISQTDYNEIGQEYIKHLHSTDDGVNFLQNITYTYNEQGWLIKINDPAIVPTSDKLFAEQLNYNLTQYGATPQYNGNIAELDYNAGISNRQHVTYGYDNLNRLINSNSTTGFSETNIGYDKGGNLTTLTRANYGTLNYSYDNQGLSNQLIGISGFDSGSYQYDVNGNKKIENTILTGGGLPNITKNNTITYNYLNLPQNVSGTQNITYTYSAAGQKLKKISGNITIDYIDGIQYVNGVIDFIQTEEGRVINSGSGYNYEYTLTDHLGNNRVAFDTQSGTANKVGEDDYYPFGFNVHRQQNAGNKYLYNQKELQEELNEYDYGARFYDPVIARWTSVDPLTEFTRRHTPYEYAMNNPMRFNDPTGMAANDTIKASLPVVEIHDVKPKQSTIAAIGSFLWRTVDYLPFAGSVKQIGVGIAHGSLKEAGLGVVMLGVDVVSGGEGGELIRVAETGAEDILKVSAEDEVKEIAEQEVENEVKSTVENGAKNVAENDIPKDFKETKEFGKKHGQKVYKKGNKYYSKDVDGHNGGVWKVFEKSGGKLKRIGTADKNLNIFKK